MPIGEIAPNGTSSNGTSDVEESGGLFNITLNTTTAFIVNNTTRIYGNDGLIGTLETDSVDVNGPTPNSTVGAISHPDIHITWTTGQKRAGGDTTSIIQNPNFHDVTNSEQKKDFLQELFGSNTVTIILAAAVGLVILTVLVFVVLSKRRRSKASASDHNQVGEWQTQAQHREPEEVQVGDLHGESRV